eukprot:scaffold1251_cov87-Skeletonema_menzelii.AAC.1
MNTKQTNPIGSDAIRRIAELEAINDTLREALSSKNAHIAMLEERLLTMSIELASSRAREDEQNLLLRRRSSQVSMHNYLVQERELDQRLSELFTSSNSLKLSVKS